MFKNFFKVAFRNLFRQKGYSLLNLVGLSLGIACGLLLTLHIKEELSYEKSFPNHERIYRVVTTEWSKSHPPLAGELKKYFPEIKSVARFSDAGTSVVNAGPERKSECKGYFADSSVMEVFGFKPVLGDVVKALSEPYSIVITRSMSEKFFGKNDPLGQQLIFNNKDTAHVRAVIEDLPANTHLKFDYLYSMTTFYKWVNQRQLDSRGWMFGWTYVLFNNKEDVKKVEKKFTGFWLNYYGGNQNKQEVTEDAKTIRFQPVTDIHLTSNLIQEMGPNSSIVYVYIFIAVEVLILLIACVNFINLFTTQALKRLKEVAIRKVLGAQKLQVVLQFLGEAFILTILSGLAAIALYEVALPFYNNIAGKQVTASEIFRPANLAILLGIIFFAGLLSGLFPALFISRFDPASSLKGAKLPKSSANYLRKGLITFQFVVAGFLLISTILIYQQMQLFRDKQLGFDKDNVVSIKLYGQLSKSFLKDQDVIKNELLSNPDIVAVGRSSNLIGDDLSVESVTPVNNESTDREYPSVRVFRVDDGYLNVLNIQLKEGRNFSRAFNDSASFIINEKAAQVLGLKQPLGSTVVSNTMGVQGKIVGIMKDFHFTSLHNQIEPLVLEYKPKWTGNLLVRIKAGKSSEAVAFLQKKVEKIAPGTLFSYGFLDDHINGLYKKEDNMSQVLKLFTFLSIIISCLGLFGLAAHAAEMRTKEIGIRKVIGADLSSLLKLMSKDFIILVLIGNLVAWPLAWYAINKWLQTFTYRINIHWQVFLISALITFVIAMLTISYHCIKTARTNPVKSLKTE
jgi:putative ABC transport system permease protein